jgi:hypothetical protein
MPTLVRAFEKPVGPASKTFFKVEPQNFQLDPLLAYPESLRVELSSIHSELFFLKPHGLYLCAMEDRPMLDFFDHEKYERARLLYSNNECPIVDLDSCYIGHSRSWTRVYRSKGLIP